jgi:hypothetical protein
MRSGIACTQRYHVVVVALTLVITAIAIAMCITTVIDDIGL